MLSGYGLQHFGYAGNAEVRLKHTIAWVDNFSNKIAQEYADVQADYFLYYCEQQQNKLTASESGTGNSNGTGKTNGSAKNNADKNESKDGVGTNVNPPERGGGGNDVNTSVMNQVKTYHDDIVNILTDIRTLLENESKGGVGTKVTPPQGGGDGNDANTTIMNLVKTYHDDIVNILTDIRTHLENAKGHITPLLSIRN